MEGAIHCSIVRLRSSFNILRAHDAFNLIGLRLILCKSSLYMSLLIFIYDFPRVVRAACTRTHKATIGLRHVNSIVPAFYLRGDNSMNSLRRN